MGQGRIAFRRPTVDGYPLLETEEVIVIDSIALPTSHPKYGYELAWSREVSLRGREQNSDYNQLCTSGTAHLFCCDISFGLCTSGTSLLNLLSVSEERKEGDRQAEREREMDRNRDYIKA